MHTLDQDCIFCKIILGQIPSKVIYQTPFSLVFKDIAPQAPIHYLIIPKKHIKDLVSCTQQDQEFLQDILSIPSLLAQQSEESSSFKLMTNNGFAAGQRVFHLHFHFMAGKSF